MSRPRARLFSTLFDQAMVSGFNFLMALVLARVLGPAAYGQFVLLFGVFLFVSALQLSLLISPMMTLGQQHAARQESYFARVLILNLAFIVLMELLFALASGVLPAAFPDWGLQDYRLPMAVALVFVLSQEFFRRYYFATGNTTRAALTDLLTYGARLVLLLLLWRLQKLDGPTAFWCVAISSAMGTVPAALDFIRHGLLRGVGWAQTQSIARQHWQAGKWLLASSISHWFAGQLLFYLAAALLLVEDVGAMYATLSLVGVANILLLSLENMVPARAASLYAEGGAHAMSRYLKQVSAWGLAVATPVFLILGGFAGYWVELAYGEQYYNYAWLLWWWCAYYVASFLLRPVAAGLRVLDRSKGIFHGYLAGALLVLILAAWVMQHYGLAGAMFMFCAVQLVMLLVQGLILLRSLARAPGPASATAGGA